MQKAKLIQTINADHSNLEAALAALTTDQLESSREATEWTVKETLIHITYWEKTLLADFAIWKRGDHPVELQGQAGIDDVNAETLRNAGGLPLSRVLEEFSTSFRNLQAWLDVLDEADLNKPFMYGMSLGGFIEEDTFKHYREHLHLLDPSRFTGDGKNNI